jgi:putative endonuclease
MHTTELGSLAEEVAACLLRMRGYDILERNYRFRRKEIDIVASRGERIAFVEVKFRSAVGRGLPREAVDRRKRRHVVFAARGFLMERKMEERSCRFDVVEVRMGKAGAALVAEHLPGAFDAEGR